MSKVASSLAPQYWALTKPRVVALIVFTAIIGMLLAIQPGDEWPWTRLLAGSIGIWLAAASAAAINHLLDQRIDKLMARTADRPLATGMLRPMQVLAFASALGIASMAILLVLVNAITALLTFASLIGYAFVYTGFLKRATPQNIVIGGIAGAAPPLLGWAAVTGMQGARDWEYALLLVLIIFRQSPGAAATGGLSSYWAVYFGISMLIVGGILFGRRHIASRLPSLEVLDDVMYKAIAVGFAFFTIATVLGALWAAEAWVDTGAGTRRKPGR